MDNLAALGLLSLISNKSDRSIKKREVEFADSFVLLIDLPGYPSGYLSVQKDSKKGQVVVKGNYREKLEGPVLESYKKDLEKQLNKKMTKYETFYNVAVEDGDEDLKKEYAEKLLRVRSEKDSLERGVRISTFVRKTHFSFDIPTEAEVIGKNVPFTYENGILKIVLKKRKTTPKSEDAQETTL